MNDRSDRRTIRGEREWTPLAPAYRRGPAPPEEDGWAFRVVLYAVEFFAIALIFLAPFATAVWWMAKR